jgi:hypothetical protein
MADELNDEVPEAPMVRRRSNCPVLFGTGGGMPSLDEVRKHAYPLASMKVSDNSVMQMNIDVDNSTMVADGLPDDMEDMEMKWFMMEFF